MTAQGINTFIVDPTTPGQVAAVNASGQLSVTNTPSGTQTIGASTIVQTSNPAYSTGITNPLVMPPTGALRVNIWGKSNNEGDTAVSVNQQFDGYVTATNGMATAAFGYVYNNTTWDRTRSINGASATGMGTIATAISPSDVSLLTEVVINQSASGDTTLVAATAAKKTRAYRLFFTVAGATTITLKDGATALTGAMTFGTGGSLTLDLDGGIPWATGTANTAFILNSSAAVQVSGRLYYTLNA